MIQAQFTVERISDRLSRKSSAMGILQVHKKEVRFSLMMKPVDFKSVLP
jgi:hypothetical protein